MVQFLRRQLAAAAVHIPSELPLDLYVGAEFNEWKKGSPHSNKFGLRAHAAIAASRTAITLTNRSNLGQRNGDGDAALIARLGAARFPFNNGPLWP